MKPPYLVRSEAAQACVDRFSGRPLSWGKVDCAQIVLHDLRQLGVSTKAWKGLTYSTEIGAARALRARGFDGLGAAMDALGLERIAPAMAVMGDVIGVETEGDLWDCGLTVRVSPQFVLGLYDGAAQPMQLNLAHAITAWRCNPCRR